MSTVTQLLDKSGLPEQPMPVLVVRRKRVKSFLLGGQLGNEAAQFIDQLNLPMAYDSPRDAACKRSL